MAVPIGMYTLSNAQVAQDGSEEMVIVSEKTSWMPPVLGGIGLAVLGFLMLITGQMIFLLLGLLAFSFAFFLLTNLPYSGRAAFNFTTREIAFTNRYVLRAPRLIDFTAPLDDLLHAGFRGGPRPNTRIVELVFRNGTRVALDFGARSAEAERSLQRLKSLRLPVPDEKERMNAAARAAYFGPQIEMQQRLRTWSVWMFIMAVVQLASGSGLNPWAMLLIVVGAASFYFRVASMFIMYAVIIAWAGVSNLLLVDEVMWKGFAILQAYWAYQLVTEFRRFNRIERIAQAHPEVEEHADLNVQTARAGAWFPWVSLLVGIFSIGLFGLLLLTMLGSALLGGISVQFVEMIGMIPLTSLFMGLLGLSTGLAGWASGYPNRAASIIGTVTSAISIIAVVVMILLGG